MTDNSFDAMVATQKVLGGEFDNLQPNEKNTLVYVFGALGINPETTRVLDFSNKKVLLDNSNCRLMLQVANGLTVEIWASTSSYRVPGNASNIEFMCHCEGLPQGVGKPREITFAGSLEAHSNHMMLSWGSLYFQVPEDYRGKTPQIYLRQDVFEKQKGARVESRGKIPVEVPESFLNMTETTLCDAYFTVAREMLAQ